MDWSSFIWGVVAAIALGGLVALLIAVFKQDIFDSD
jgi:hypothetical protein